MAKGWMIFIEGGEMPNVVHRKHKAAFYELHRLAELNKGKRALLLELTDHIRFTDEKENLGSHLPKDDRPKVMISDLVQGKTLTTAEGIK